MIVLYIYLAGVAVGLAFTFWLVWRDASWDRLAALSIALIALTWPISIPYLFWQRAFDWIRGKF